MGIRFFLLLGLLVLSFPQLPWAYTTQDCLGCHEKGSPEASRQISGKEFLESVHGRQSLSCQDCHTGIKDPSHQEIKGSGKVNCNDCHDQEIRPVNYWSWFSSFQVASHGKQDFSRLYQKSNCLGCHQGQGAHGEKSPLNNQTCYKCHGELGKRAEILGYIHPKGDLKAQPIVFAVVVLDQVWLILLGLGGAGFVWTRFRKSGPKSSGPKGAPKV